MLIASKYNCYYNNNNVFWRGALIKNKKQKILSPEDGNAIVCFGIN